MNKPGRFSAHVVNIDELVAAAAEQAAAKMADTVREAVAEALGSSGARSYLTTAQAADEINVHRVTLDSWRGEGKGPPWVRAGRRILYPRADLERWLAEQGGDQ